MPSKRYLPNRRRWQVRWYAVIDGQIRQGSRCFDTEADADHYADMAKEEIAIAKATCGNGTEPLGASIARWKVALEKSVTERTRGLYADAIDRFVASLPPTIMAMPQIASRHIADYVDGMKGLSNRTCNSHLTAIRSYCKWAARRYQAQNPASAVPMLREDPPDTRFLTPAEYRKVLAVAQGEIKDVLQFLAHTGLRVSELTGLTADAVQGNLLTVVGKGRKRRHIPLDSTAKAILARRAGRAGQYVFDFSKANYRRPRVAIGSRCRILASQAGVQPFGPHALRHLFATELLRQGTPISHVSRLLGHASIRTTENTYIHFMPDYLAGSTDRLDSLEQD